jgi:hypothetical protein
MLHALDAALDRDLAGRDDGAGDLGESCPGAASGEQQEHEQRGPPAVALEAAGKRFPFRFRHRR